MLDGLWYVFRRYLVNWLTKSKVIYTLTTPDMDMNIIMITRPVISVLIVCVLRLLTEKGRLPLYATFELFDLS